MTNLGFNLCLVAYGLVMSTFMLSCGIMCAKWANESFDQLTYPTEFMNQVSADWTSPPLLSIQVTN